MKLRLLDHLVCPLDKTTLELQPWETSTRQMAAEETARAERLGVDPTKVSTEVLQGVLINRQRKLLYPIHHGVPRMLTFRTGVVDRFREEHSGRLRREFNGFSFANESSKAGESEVLRSFSSEWTNYDWTGQTYWSLTPTAWFKCMRFVLELEQKPIRDRLVLEAGMGIGGVADYLAREEGCEIVGMDLSYAVDVGYQHFGQNPFLHIVQGSVFATPFPEQTFDFVYSFGVIHHTFSTKTALASLAQLPRRGGRLYVWVYSPHDESRTLIRRGMMTLERMLRPVISRLPEKAQAVALAPIIPLYLGHQWWQAKRGDGSVVPYGIREAVHAARDRFTPRYIHRHTESEVSAWFHEVGYDQLFCGSQHEPCEYLPVFFTACTGVSGIRR